VVPSPEIENKQPVVCSKEIIQVLPDDLLRTKFLMAKGELFTIINTIDYNVFLEISDFK